MTTTSASWISGKTVLITGASGTVGSALLQAVIDAGPAVVRALDSHEHGLFLLQQRLGDRPDIRYLLGDVRDRDRLVRALQGVDVVFHAAALKHVGIGEYNPFEIVQTNLVGLQNMILAALRNDVERVVFTSSDKAVNPTNAMGASKLMGERLMAAAQHSQGTARTRFASVRFGNIIGSNGSVTTVFDQQIRRGGPVTLTDRRMTRFVMGPEQSVQLVLRASELSVGGELFVLKMPALRVADLAEVMIRRLAPLYGYAPEEIEVTEIGARPGEKLYEELLMEAEIGRAYENAELIVYLGDEPQDESRPNRPYVRTMRPVTVAYHSDRVPHLAPEEIEVMLEGLRVLPSRDLTEALA